MFEDQRKEIRRKVIDRRHGGESYHQIVKEIRKIRHDIATPIMILLMTCDFFTVVNEEKDINSVVEIAKDKINVLMTLLDKKCKILDAKF